jgi:hypothetical protein
MKDYDEAESFSTAKELKDYWEKDENFERLKNQDYGKLNMLYTYKIVLNYREAFTKLLIKIAEDFYESKKIDNNDFVDAVKDILRFQTSKFVKIKDDWKVEDKFVEKFKFNILNWVETGYSNLTRFEEEQNFNFFLTEMQSKTLETQLEQYKTKNINLALRNMTIYTDNKQFFYQVIKN